MKKSKKKPKRWICFYCRRLNESGKRKCIYCKGNKVGSVPKLEKDLDIIFSKFIRKRDNYKCFTCGKDGNEAGHFKYRSHRSTRWDTRNVNCQCTYCNKYLSGRLDVYALRLSEKYGPGIEEELERKSKVFFQPTKPWLLEKIEEFKQRFKELESYEGS